MKMIYNGTPVKSLNIHHFEMDTNDASLQPHDMQAGVTAYAKGKKVTGTGKSFSFAMYGNFPINTPFPVPTSEINTVIISANGHAIRMANTTLGLRELNYSSAQTVAFVIDNGVEYPITLQIANNILTASCSKSITLQVMFGKDEYI